jgi:hypothetical protein
MAKVIRYICYMTIDKNPASKEKVQEAIERVGLSKECER